MTATLGPELALAMTLALESSEADIAQAVALLADLEARDPARDLAVQLLGRARRRIETVRIAIAGEPARESRP